MDALSKEQQVKVKFKYVRAPDYKLFFANGAYGGLTARGNFVMHFFNEYRPPPPEEIATIDERGTLLEAKHIWAEGETGGRTYTRELVVGVTVPSEQAVSLANWILEKMAPIEGKKAEKK